MLEHLEYIAPIDPEKPNFNADFNSKIIDSLFSESKDIGLSGTQVTQVLAVESKELRISRQFRGTTLPEQETKERTEKKGPTSNVVSLLRKSNSSINALKSLADQKEIGADSLVWPLSLRARGIRRQRDQHGVSKISVNQQIFVAAKKDLKHLDLRDLTLESLQIITKRLVQLINNFHRNNRVYLDVKPPNILVLETDQGSLYIKFCDIEGFVRVNDAGILKTEDAEFSVGTPRYCPPEINPWSGSGVGQENLKKAAGFSLGIALYEILYKAIRNNNKWGMLKKNKWGINLKKTPEKVGMILEERTRQSSDVAANLAKLKSQLTTAKCQLSTTDREKLVHLIDLITSLTQADPNQRPDLSEVTRHAFFSDDITKDIARWSNLIYQQVKPKSDTLTLDYVQQYLKEEQYQSAPFKPTLADLSLIIFHLVGDSLHKTIKDEESTSAPSEEKKYSSGLNNDSLKDPIGPITKEQVEDRLEVEEYIDGQYLTTRRLPLEDPFLLLGAYDGEIVHRSLIFHQNLDLIFNFLLGRIEVRNLDTIINTFRVINEQREQILQLIEKNPQSKIPQLDKLRESLKNNILTSKPKFENLNKIFCGFIELDKAVSKENKGSDNPAETSSKQKSKELFLFIQTERQQRLKAKQSDEGLEQLQRILIYPQSTIKLELQSKFWCNFSFFASTLGYVGGGLSLADSWLDLSNLAIGSLGLYVGMTALGLSTILLVIAFIKLCLINQQNQKLTTDYQTDLNALAEGADYSNA